MLSSLSKFSILIIYIVTIHLSHFTQSMPYDIRDLYSYDNATFIQESQSYYANIMQPAVILTTVCSTATLVGGYGVLGTNHDQFGDWFGKNFTNLLPHTAIYFSYSFWMIDSWDYRPGDYDYFYTAFDAINLPVNDVIYANQHWMSPGIDYCGQSYDDISFIRVVGIVPHSSTSLEFRVVSGLDEYPDNESFGIREVNILLVTNPVNTTASLWVKPNATLTTQMNYTWPCNEGMYYNSSSASCKSCDSSCLLCFGGTSRECFKCNGNYYWNGSQCATCNASCNATYTPYGASVGPSAPCPNYTYQNTTCLSSCPPPLASQTVGATLYCNQPCTTAGYFYNPSDGKCYANCPVPFISSTVNVVTGIVYVDECLPKTTCTAPQYLSDWNSSCVSCTSPYRLQNFRGVQVCYLPCDSGLFYYPDTGSCIASCPSPLVPNNSSLYPVCKSPCPSGQDYFPSDGSCSSACSYPMTTSTVTLFSGNVSYAVCIPIATCSASQWLTTWNATCNLCTSPLRKVTINNVQICQNPCTNPGDYYYPTGASCVSSCPSPLVNATVGSYQTCNGPCGSQYYNPNGSCTPSCASFLKTSTQSMLSGAITFPTCVTNVSCTPPQYLALWNNTCVSCPSPLRIQTNLGVQVCNVPCDTGIYYSGTSSCITSCPSPFTNNSAGIYPICNPPCSSGNYFPSDGTCSSTCSYPMTTSSASILSGTITYATCVTVTTCTASQWLTTWDGTCSSCASPLRKVTINNVQICQNPCTNPGDYYYPTGATCVSSCPSPLVNTTVGSYQTCSGPCGSQYYNPDGSCTPSCASFLKTSTQSMLSGVITFPTCIANVSCTPPQYLALWNNTCVSCPSPLRIQTNLGVQVCNVPCDTGIYYSGTSSCITSCPSPFTNNSAGIYPICNPPCSSGNYFPSDGTCSSTCSYPMTTSSASILSGTITYSTCVPVTTCTASQWLTTWDGTCSSCASPLRKVTINKVQICENPCTNPGDYYYPTGATCVSSCPSPLVNTTVGSYQTCSGPCGSQYYNPDGSCSATCDTYLTTSTQSMLSGVITFNTCIPPITCTASQWLTTWNTTCINSCTSPLIQSTVRGVKMCSNPCPSGNFYYPPGSNCLSSCPSPLLNRTVGSYQECDNPCGLQYYNPDTSCTSSCTFPLIASSQSMLSGAVTYPTCVSPVSCNASQYLSIWNITCIDDCATPFKSNISHGIATCALPCYNSSYYYNIDTQQCQSTCSSIITYVQNLYYQCSSTPVSTNTLQNSNQDDENPFLKYLSTPPSTADRLTFITIAKSIEHVRYLDITFPKRLERLNVGTGQVPLSSCYKMPPLSPQMITIQSGTIPDVFSKYGLAPSFLANILPYLINISLIVIFIAMAYVLEGLSKLMSKPKAHTLFQRARYLLVFNYSVMFFASNMDYLTLFSLLEFYSVRFSDGLSIVSFFLALTFVGLGFFITIFAFIICRSSQKARNEAISQKSPSKYLNFISKWQSVQVLFRGYTDKEKANSYFYVIYLIRIALPMLIAVSANGCPLMQTVLYTSISGFLLVYLIIAKPIQQKMSYVQVIGFEILVFIVHISSIVLVATGQLNSTNTRAGDVIIGCNALINIWPVTFLTLKFYLGLKRAVLLQKTGSKLSRAAFIELIFLPLQAACFGFESVQITAILESDAAREIIAFQSQASPYKNINRVAPISTETSISVDSSISSGSRNSLNTLPNKRRIRNINVDDIASLKSSGSVGLKAPKAAQFKSTNVANLQDSLDSCHGSKNMLRVSQIQIQPKESFTLDSPVISRNGTGAFSKMRFDNGRNSGTKLME